MATWVTPFSGTSTLRGLAILSFVGRLSFPVADLGIGKKWGDRGGGGGGGRGRVEEEGEAGVSTNFSAGSSTIAPVTLSAPP